MSLAGDGVAAAAPLMAAGVNDEVHENGIDFDSGDLQHQFNTLLQTTANRPLARRKTDQQLNDWFARIKQNGQPALNAADKEASVNIVAARTAKSHDEAQ